MLTVTILDRIKELAKDKHISISEIEKRAGIGNGVIRRWGESTPTSENLNKVARILNVSSEFLLNGERKSKKEVVINRKISGLSNRDLEILEIIIDKMLSDDE